MAYKNKQIRVENSMLRSSLCDYSNAQILMSESIAIGGARANDAEVIRWKK